MRLPPLVALALVAAAAPALADTVRLKNGQVLTGDVEDRGPYVLVKKPLGDVRIERREILSIELEGAAAPQAERDFDIVVLLSGDEIAGRVRLEDGGRRVVVARKLGDHESALELDHRQVRTILWAQGAGREGPTRAGIGDTIAKLLDELRSTDEAVRARAHGQLIDLGVFTLPYLEKRPVEADPAVEELLRQVVAVARMRTYLTPAIVEKVPNLARRLVAPDPNERVEALREAILASPKDCPPLLNHIARHDQAKEVRAFILGQLAQQNRSAELLDLLQAPDGSVRLAAAVALGDNGVYVGIPLLIEALKLEDAAIRKLAIAKLEEWTGQFLGYFADDPADKRSAAIERWETWWATDGKKFAADSVRATIRKDQVTEDEKQLGLADWVRAQKAWDAIGEANLTGEARKVEVEKVRFLLRKAIESYPQCVNARLSLGVLAYTELGDVAAAREELEVLLQRYSEDGGALTKVLAHYHLGRIAEIEKKLVDADRHYRQARAIDPRNIEVLRALGTLCYDRAVKDETLSAEERRALLVEAAGAFGDAIRAADQREYELRESARAGDVVSPEDPFKHKALLRTLETGATELRATSAELRYLRGRAYGALHKRDEAYRDFTAASQLDPENAVFRDAARAWAPSEADAPKPGERFHPSDVK